MADEVIVTPSLADAVAAAKLQAKAAKTSADAAAQSAEDAAGAAEDVYANVNYGILAADPSMRPDGTPSQNGDEYYNSISRAKKMYIDGQWSVVALTISAGVLVAGQNLNDVASKSAARTNLGLGSAATRDVGAIGGVAELDAGGKVPAAQLDISAAGGLEAAANLLDLDDAATARANLGLGDAATKTIGAASGAAGLDGNAKVPAAQLPAGDANGVASLDAQGHVPLAQMMAGQANGIAQLNSSGVVPANQLPGFGNPTSNSQSGDYTTISGDNGKVITVTTGSSADVTITLIAATTAGDGALMTVQKVDTGTKKCIVEDSDGTTQIAWLSNQWDVVCFRSNGSVWTRHWHRITPRVDVYSNFSGNWTKPPLAQMVCVEIYGAGGGGGSGAKVAQTGTANGGSSGGGGARLEAWFRTGDLSSTEAIVAPAGGAGGAAKSSYGAGNPGSSPADATFGTTIKLRAQSGSGGGGGPTSTSPGSASTGGGQWFLTDATGDAVAWEGAGEASGAGTDGNNAYHGGASGGLGSTSATGGDGGSSIYGAGAGGAGGGFAYQGSQRAGGAGGKRNSYSPGGGGAGGSAGGGDGTSGPGIGIGGGGGGSKTSSGDGGDGGNGGIGAGGGGGGGVYDSTGISGKGGDGGDAQVTVTTVF